MGIELFLYATNILLTFLVFVLHLAFTRSNYAANRLLSIFLFCSFYISLMLVLFESRWIFHVPHFYRTGAACLFVFFPAMYLYTKKIVDQEGWKRTDLMHLIPLGIYLADYSLFFLLPASEKARILHKAYDQGGLFSFGETIIFPEYFHHYFRTAVSLFYISLMGWTCYSRFYGEKNAIFKQDNGLLLKWLGMIFTLVSLQTLANGAVVGLASQKAVVRFTAGFTYISNTLMVLFLLFHPKLIYGVRGLWLPQEQEPVEGPVPAEVPAGISRVYLKEDQVNAIGQAIEKALITERKFLVKGYGMQDLMQDTGYSNHQLSVYINTHIGMNFKEYINGLRVDHLLKEMDKKKSLELFTVDALADVAGFSNRFSFLQAFKKATGETPSDLLRRRRSSA